MRGPNGLELSRSAAQACFLILGHLGRQGTTAFSPASRVGFSELLGGVHRPSLSERVASLSVRRLSGTGTKATAPSVSQKASVFSSGETSKGEWVHASVLYGGEVVASKKGTFHFGDGVDHSEFVMVVATVPERSNA